MEPVYNSNMIRDKMKIMKNICMHLCACGLHVYCMWIECGLHVDCMCELSFFMSFRVFTHITYLN